METSAGSRRIRWIFIAVVWLLALGGALAVLWSRIFPVEQPEMLLGDEYRNEQLKFSISPPARWRRSEMADDLKKLLGVEKSLLTLYFTGPNPGDGLTLLVYESDQSLDDFAARTLARIPAAARAGCNQKFFDLNGMPAWGCEWTLEGDVVLHRFDVLVRHGGRHVWLSYAAVETSYSRQRDAIAESLSSLSFW